MISVCMASYNGENFIIAQINSILQQLSINDELIISDDCSSDKTVYLIKLLSDPRIILLENRENIGVTLNFERAFDRAKGDLIFLSDQDDIWVENKVKLMLSYFEKTSYSCIISDAYIVDEQLAVLSESLQAYEQIGNGMFKNIIKNGYYGCCMAVRREMLLKCLPMPKTDEIGHDLWLGLSADRTHQLLFIPDKLIYFRRHSFTKTQLGIGESKRTVWQKIKGRIVILYYFFCKLMKS